MKRGTGHYEALLYACTEITERAILTVKHAINQGRFSNVGVYVCKDITREQTEKGINWLRTNKNRKVCAALSDRDKACIGSLFKRFTFDGFAYSTRCLQFGVKHVEPIYTVHASDGSWFSYSYIDGAVRVHGRG